MATFALTDFGFFDWNENDTGDTYLYSAEEFCRIIDMICGSGVVRNQLNRFDASWSAASATLTIGTGAAIINGHWVLSDSPVVHTFTSAGEFYASLEVDTVNRTVNIKIDTEATTAPYSLFKITTGANGLITGIVDQRTFIYNGTSLPTCQVIVSDNDPGTINGAIWLKPVSI